MKGQDLDKRVTPTVDTVEDVERNKDSENEHLDIPEVAEKPKRGWRSYIWDSLDKSPEERKLVFKLDCALLTIGCLCECIPFPHVDRSDEIRQRTSSSSLTRSISTTPLSRECELRKSFPGEQS